MTYESINWDDNLLFIGNEVKVNESVDKERRNEVRKEIEPWLSAIFQSEQFSLLVGSGLSNALADIAGIDSQDMSRLKFEGEYNKLIEAYAKKTADNFGRGAPNFEDDLRASLELLRGYEIQNITTKDNNSTEESEGVEEEKNVDNLRSEIDKNLAELVKNILASERKFLDGLKTENVASEMSLKNLKTFLLSFASRSSSRERLNLFTTNYDRFIEYGFDSAGILYLDRFVGSLNPKFRETKLNYDYHYNPPGIRGEPRHVEGVVKYSKLHGSIDWKSSNKEVF